MSDFFTDIYAHKAADYEEMVSYEDYEGNIRTALWDIRPWAGLDVVELGAGTGRLSMLLAPEARRITAADISRPMLAVATHKLEASGLSNWETRVADNRDLPLEDACADIAIAGWSLGHSVGWYPDDWQSQVGLALSEMERVLRPGGTSIILETLGTGRETPQPPTDGLASLYRWLEDEKGFTKRWIRTDYRFDSPGHAAEKTRFFFGDELAGRILHEGWSILPECTGIWFRSKIKDRR